MKKTILLSLSLVLAGLAGAVDMPSGLTGLWLFQTSADKLKAAIGQDLVNSTPANAGWLPGPWTKLGVAWHAELYSDGGIIMDRSWDYLTVNPGFTANGGGSYVNEYTILWDVNPDPNLNSLYQTAYEGNSNDGDLWIDATTRTASTIGVDEVGFSSNTFDGTKWHRIVLSVKNGDFFRVYVDGTNYLEGAGQPVDGRFSLYPDRFHLFADNNWQDAWIRCGTVAVWNRALASEEVAALGGWIDGAATPTELLFTNQIPELLSVSPANGETNGAPEIAYEAKIVDPVRVIATNTVQLLLDGVPAFPQVMHQGAMVIVRLGGGLFQGGTTHIYTLIAAVSGIYSTNEVTFTVQNYTGYEWRFTNADLSAALGNGVMSYADESTTPGLTSFGTTDGSTVPHISGSPAKYMHVPAFTLNTDGYLLQFNDSGPNGGASAYINRYTLVFDMLVPGPTPWPAWVVPYFNANPYNLDSDADFYLSGAGEIGIGSGGYSATNTITADTWYRIAFVADLKANTLAYYVNGTNVKSRAADGLGGRWSLYSNQDAGPDLLLFNEPWATSTHELYVSSVAFTDRVLSPAELAVLGGPSANGILVGSFAPRPTLTIQASGGGAMISWPTNCVGYALLQADSLAAPQWTPVAGITNNSVSISAGDVTRFFRLVQ